MAPKYKLTYFDYTGLGEPIRYIFKFANIPFEDNRISMQEWPKLKPNTPFGHIPILEFEGKTLHQSLAIARYVARQGGLAGDNDLEAYEIDAAVDSVNELRIAILEYFLEKDAVRKAAIKESLVKEKLPFYLGKLDSWAAANNGYLANKKVSWADLYLVAVFGFSSQTIQIDLFEGYPNLQKVKQNVLANPGLKSWVERKTD